MDFKYVVCCLFIFLIGGCLSKSIVAYKIGETECIEIDTITQSVVYATQGLPQDVLGYSAKNHTFSRTMYTKNNGDDIVLTHISEPSSFFVSSTLCGISQNVTETNSCDKTHYTPMVCNNTIQYILNITKPNTRVVFYANGTIEMS